MSPRTKSMLTLAAIVSPFVIFAIIGRFLINPWELPRQNKGTLLIPHISMQALQTRDAQNMPLTEDTLAGQWSLLYIASAECDTACKNGLYYQIRQVRRALGEDVQRVRRVILHTAPAAESLTTFLNDNVSGMVQLYGDAATITQALGDTPTPVGQIYIVSPDGQIFMRYPTHESMDATLEEAENIRLDLKRTLKGSLIG